MEQTKPCEVWINKNTQCLAAPTKKSRSGVYLCKKHGRQIYNKYWDMRKDMSMLQWSEEKGLYWND